MQQIIESLRHPLVAFKYEQMENVSILGCNRLAVHQVRLFSGCVQNLKCCTDRYYTINALLDYSKYLSVCDIH